MLCGDEWKVPPRAANRPLSTSPRPAGLCVSLLSQKRGNGLCHIVTFTVRQCADIVSRPESALRACARDGDFVSFPCGRMGCDARRHTMDTGAQPRLGLRFLQDVYYHETIHAHLLLMRCAA